MKKVLAFGAVVGLALSFSSAVYADTTINVWCNPISPTAQGQFISCELNANGSLASSCSCPQNFVLIDPTNFPPSNSSGTPTGEPTVPSRT